MTHPRESELAKIYWRENHHQGARVPPRDEQPHRYELAEYIVALKPQSILEFGCSSARNLAILRQLLPDCELVGIDLNPITVAVGRDANPTLQLILGDESYLPQFVDKSFDVVFVCSVLDHVPNPEWRAVYDHLKRIAGQRLILLEPMMWSTDGKSWIEADYSDLLIAAAGYSYAHDYPGHDADLRIVRPLPIASSNYPEFGGSYMLMEVRR